MNFIISPQIYSSDLKKIRNLSFCRALNGSYSTNSFRTFYKNIFRRISDNDWRIRKKAVFQCREEDSQIKLRVWEKERVIEVLEVQENFKNDALKKAWDFERKLEILGCKWEFQKEIRILLESHDDYGFQNKEMSWRVWE